MWQKLTNGGRCCQLLGSPVPRLSLRRKLISTMRAAPAAINVYPNIVCTMVLSGNSCGWALMPQPVKKMTIPGRMFLLGRPVLLRDNQTPKRPAHHQTIPMVVCWRSFRTQGCPQLCSVKVFTQPHAAMTMLSKNSWLRPVVRSHAWPTIRRSVMMIPYAMNALPMMKCARHWPKWSSRQYPMATMPPKSICAHATIGMSLPTQLCTMSTPRRPPRPALPPNIRPIHPFFSSRCSFSPIPSPTCTSNMRTKLLAKLAWIFGCRNCRPRCRWPRKYATVAMMVPRICRGTCHRLLMIPRTMPYGKINPKERIINSMCTHSRVSSGSGETASPSGILSVCSP